MKALTEAEMPPSTAALRPKIPHIFWKTISTLLRSKTPRRSNHNPGKRYRSKDNTGDGVDYLSFKRSTAPAKSDRRRRIRKREEEEDNSALVFFFFGNNREQHRRDFN